MADRVRCQTVTASATTKSAPTTATIAVSEVSFGPSSEVIPVASSDPDLELAA